MSVEDRLQRRHRRDEAVVVADIGNPVGAVRTTFHIMRVAASAISSASGASVTPRSSSTVLAMASMRRHGNVDVAGEEPLPSCDEQIVNVGRLRRVIVVLAVVTPAAIAVPLPEWKFIELADHPLNLVQQVL